MINEWNRQNPHDKITFSENKPRTSLNKLHKKIKKCDQDICLLDVIPDKLVRDKLKNTAFAPVAPSSWKSNKNEWLSNYDIKNVMKQYEEAHDDFKFLGPSPIDFDTKLFNNNCIYPEICSFDVNHYLQNTHKRRFGFVFNTDPHTSSGSHWISMYLNLDKPYIFYFDSNGNQAPDEIKRLIEKIYEQCKACKMRLRVDSNENFIHQRSNTECGMYSLFFLINVLEGKYRPTDFKKKRFKDEEMESFRKIYFNHL